MAIKHLSNEWNQILEKEFSKEYFQKLTSSVNNAYKTTQTYPPVHSIFRALQLCEFDKIRAVIIGQDPYHGYGQANGLCFSVSDGIALPPSLQNIFKELKTEIQDFEIPKSGDLSGWAQQGVLLLNAILSVESGKPGSHKNFGWENFTDGIISLINERKRNVVFLLWGNYARTKINLIDPNKHLVLEAAHPSPLARGAFFGCKHFSKTNNYLQQHGIKIIDWKKTKINDA